MREDEDLRGGDWVKPFFYPAPDCGEEGGGADYLGFMLVLLFPEFFSSLL